MSTQQKFIQGIQGMGIKNNKLVVLYAPTQKGSGRSLRSKATPYVMTFITGLSAQLLYDAYNVFNNMRNEKNPNVTNMSIFKKYVKANYGTTSQAFRKLILQPGFEAALAGAMYPTLKKKLKTQGVPIDWLNNIERFISGAKKPGRKPGSQKQQLIPLQPMQTMQPVDIPALTEVTGDVSILPYGYPSSVSEPQEYVPRNGTELTRMEKKLLRMKWDELAAIAETFGIVTTVERPNGKVVNVTKKKIVQDWSERFEFE